MKKYMTKKEYKDIQQKNEEKIKSGEIENTVTNEDIFAEHEIVGGIIYRKADKEVKTDKSKK